jgi:hypothetical protein
MKKVLSVVFFVSGFLAGAQSVNQTIEKQFKMYSKLIIDHKINEALNYTNPEMFKIVPREQMVTTMEEIFKNPQVDLKTLMPTVSGFEPVRKINGKNYVRFKSHTVIEMKFNTQPKEAQTAEEKMVAREMMATAIEQKFGKDNVTYNEATGFYKVKSTKSVVASSDDLKDWKFIVVENPKMKPMLSKFIPAELLE